MAESTPRTIAPGGRAQLRRRPIAVASAAAALALAILAFAGRSHAPAQALPEFVTFVGDIRAVNYLPEDIAPGDDCGGGQIAITINAYQMELRSVEVRAFRVVGLPNSQVVTFEPGQVPIAEGGSFSTSGPLPGLQAVSATLDGSVDLQANPADVQGSLHIFFGSGPSLCETTYAATFSKEGLPPLPTPTLAPGIQELPGALNFSGAVEAADARASTGLSVGPCGGGSVRIVTDPGGTYLLGVQVTGFRSLGSPVDTTTPVEPGSVPIDPNTGAFTFDGGGEISRFIEGTFDFSADPPTVIGKLGTRGLLVCEAAFSAALTAGESPARASGLQLPSTGTAARHSGAADPWPAVLAGAGALALVAGAFGMRTRRR